jgi:hypothetical protein
MWCRRKTAFFDLPLWREIAEQLELPLYQVVASPIVSRSSPTRR